VVSRASARFAKARDFKMFVFGHKIPLKVVLTPYSKNVIMNQNLIFFKDTSFLMDISSNKL
jgi:hypothetical protein